jgi:uncharacterized protein with NRDE domain
LLAGRDEEAGGTWLGINRRGRFAMLTNVRSPAERNPHAPSRGGIVVSALQTEIPALSWAGGQLPERAAAYNGFNLLLGDLTAVSPSSAAPALVYTNNRTDEVPRPLAPGIYGLSNAFLDTPWPKVTRSVSRFAMQLAARVDADAFFSLMADRRLAADADLPSTGVPLEWERVLSAVQIRALGYGTRTTTIVTVRRDGLVNFVERSFETAQPDLFSDRSYEFMVDGVRRHSGGIGAQRDR